MSFSILPSLHFNIGKIVGVHPDTSSFHIGQNLAKVSQEGPVIIKEIVALLPSFLL